MPRVCPPVQRLPEATRGRAGLPAVDVHHRRPGGLVRTRQPAQAGVQGLPVARGMPGLRRAWGSDSLRSKQAAPPGLHVILPAGLAVVAVAVTVSLLVGQAQRRLAAQLQLLQLRAARRGGAAPLDRQGGAGRGASRHAALGSLSPPPAADDGVNRVGQAGWDGRARD
eukprot:scaffold10059_cov123-Isochrysis_galbana.AAC.2